MPSIPFWIGGRIAENDVDANGDGLVDDPDEPVAVSISDNRIVFGFSSGEGSGRAIIASNLVEGSFPPFEDVIPNDQDKKVTFDVGRLRSAIRRAAPRPIIWPTLFIPPDPPACPRASSSHTRT